MLNDLDEVIDSQYDLFYSCKAENDEQFHRLYDNEHIEIDKVISIVVKLYDHNTRSFSIDFFFFHRLFSILIIGMPFEKRPIFLNAVVKKYINDQNQEEIILKAFSVMDRSRFNCNAPTQLEGLNATKAVLDNVVIPSFLEDNAMHIFRHGSLFRMYWMDLLRTFPPDLKMIQYAGGILTPIAFVKAFAPILDESKGDNWSSSNSNLPLFKRITIQISKFIEHSHEIVKSADALIIEILIYSGSVRVKDLLFLDQPNLISNFCSTNGKTHLFELFRDRVQFGAMTNSFVLDQLDVQYLHSYILGLYDQM